MKHLFIEQLQRAGNIGDWRQSKCLRILGVFVAVDLVFDPLLFRNSYRLRALNALKAVFQRICVVVDSRS